MDLPVLPAALEWGEGETLLAGRDVLAVYSWGQGRTTTLCRFDLGDDVRLNDGSVAPSGDVWIGSMTEGGAGRRSQLFRVSRDGASTVQLEGIGISNGLVWDGPATAYYVDSTHCRVDRLHVDASGDLASRETAVELDGPGEPDGLALDRDGILHVAMWDGARIVAVDLHSGAVRDVPLQVPRPTSLAFGGRDDELVFVTTASVESARPVRAGGTAGTVGLLRSHRGLAPDATGKQRGMKTHEPGAAGSLTGTDRHGSAEPTAHP